MKDLLLKNTPPFRLKDRMNKNYRAIDIVKQFGFIPEVIIFERIAGTKDIFVVRAVVPDRLLAQEKAKTITK